MGIRFYKPVTPGRRGASVSDFAEITDKKKRPEKELTIRAKKKGGRNNQGKITSLHRGGGHKRLYRKIDFKRDKDGVRGTVTHIEYDPNRSSRIALVQYADGEKRYILAPEGLAAGMVVESGVNLEPNVGNCMLLGSIPPGTMVHNIEMQPGRGGQLCRSAGVGATLNAREGRWAQVTLPSGEVRRLPGIRPRVRGTAMNPTAHPMGGGEGRNSGGRHPCSPTGKLAKGGRTRNRKKASAKAIIRRRRSVRYGEVKL